MDNAATTATRVASNFTLHQAADPADRPGRSTITVDGAPPGYTRKCRHGYYDAVRLRDGEVLMSGVGEAHAQSVLKQAGLTVISHDTAKGLLGALDQTAYLEFVSAEAHARDGRASRLGSGMHRHVRGLGEEARASLARGVE